MNLLFQAFFSLGVFVFLSYPAQAYLDPGSGSFLFQLIVGGILSGLFAIKLYFRKIKSFFSRNKKSQEEHAEPKQE